MAADARAQVRAPERPLAAAPPARAAVGASAACRTLDVDGVRLALDDDGAGDPVLCLHAVAHGAADFAGFRARHRDRFRVLALDWPGHGRSGDDRVAPSSARYGDLLARLLDAASLERVILVGNSIGGAAALRVAAARPDRVRGVVAANSAGLVAYGPPKRLVTRALATFFALGARDARWFPRAYAALYRSILSQPAAAAQRARIVAAGPEMAPLLARAWQSFGQPDDDLSALLPTVTCPVLVTWSVGDRLNPLAFNRAGIARLPHGRLETFPGGHAPFLECPDAFDAAFARFVRQLT
jgi:4,5:9,10-diseco-3-hydroxy-5,9,17-trioxoandrosta-1(10),2-diene-4-oate hydrolase